MSGPALTLVSVAAYGSLHSLLASRWAKRRAARIFGQPGTRLYRLAYNLLAVVTLIPVLAIPATAPGPLLYRLTMPWFALAIAGQSLSLVALAAGLLQTDARHFVGLRQLTQPDEGGAPTLVVTGLYHWVRHPLYTAGLALIWLTPVMTASLLAFNLGLTAYVLVGSGFEEARLSAEFGPAYADYQRRVPRLLPRLLPGRPSS